MKKIICIILTICTVFCCFQCLGCGNEKTDENSAGKYIVQVGYDFEIPEELKKDFAFFKIKDSNNQATDIENNVVYFDKTGNYTLICSCKDKTFEKEIMVVDTEKPSFKTLSSGSDRYFAYADYDSEVDLRDYFVPYDNSGSADVKFEVYAMGADKVELTDGSKFKVNMKNSLGTAYYTVKATASDESGNNRVIKLKLGVKLYIDYSEVDYYIATDDSSALPVVLIPSELEVGTSVKVHCKIKKAGLYEPLKPFLVKLKENDKFGGTIIEPKGSDKKDALTTEDIEIWTDLTFDAVIVKSGNKQGVKLRMHFNEAPYKPIKHPGQHFLLNDVVISAN